MTPSLASLWRALDASPAPFLITDRGGEVVYANAGVSGRTGYSRGEIIGRTPGELWGGQMPRAFYRRLWRRLEIEQQPFFGAVTNRDKQGRSYSDELSLAPIRNAAGRAVYYLALQNIGNEPGLHFQTDIQTTFDRKRCTVNGLIRALQRWYAPKGEQRPRVRQADPEGFIRECFVLPTKKLFGGRAEDRELLQATLDDPAQFEALYAKYSPKIYQYFLRHLSDRNRAEDCMQETFFRAFQAISKYEFRNATYGTFLLRIAHNILVNAYRHEAWLPLEAAAEPESAAPPTDFAWLWDAPQLTRLERQAIELYYRLGYAIREVGERLDRSDNAVKLLLSRARRKLKQLVV